MMLREAKLVRYPFGNYWWQEVNPHEYQIRRADPTQTIIGRLVEVPAHGRDKGKWVLPDANQEYPVSETAVMGLELWHKWDVVTAPSTPVQAPLPTPEPPAPPVVVAAPEPPDDLAGWLSVQEVAALMGVPDSTVHGRIKTGQLKAQKALVRTPQGYSRMRWRIAPLATQDARYVQPRLSADSTPVALPPDPDTAGYLTTSNAAAAYGVSRNEMMMRLKAGEVPGAIKVPHGNRAGFRYLVPPPVPVPVEAPEPEPEAPPVPIAAIPQAPGEGTDQDWYRQFVDLRNAHQTDMRDLARDLGRLLTRLETVEYELAQLRHAPAPVPHTAPSFWQRLTGTPSNGQSEAQP